uniref:Uncharacterized protein n=1 Tax=Manihot esculenta TaxID=3983 RepID=A0A2C9V596_MANES
MLDKDCLKAYHSRCVEKDDSFLESDVPWRCKWHFCFICKNTPKFHCFCCAKAVCGRCFCNAEFAVITGKRGFCNHCLTLIGLIEGIENPNFNEGKIDFNDRDTYEFVFKSYWEMIKSKEGLASKHVHKLLNKGADTEYIDSNDIFEGEEAISEFEVGNELTSDNEDLNNRKRHEGIKRWKSNKGKQSVINKKVKSNKREFDGWGSKLLFEFLASIGEETKQELSQHDVTAIVIRYCEKHKLFHPEKKKKKIICDPMLKSLLGRKSVNKNSIHKLLTPHFAENFEQSEDDFGYSSEGKGRNVSMACKRQRISSTDRNSQKKEAILDVQTSCFASVVAENIKLVYLKRSLVEELSKQSEVFDDKVMGSYVRIKSDPYDYSQKNSHQLVEVTGIKRTSRSGLVNADILLQVSNTPKDIPICKLSDDNFSKEECEDLQQRVKEGQLERPTVVEFKEKAKSLHEVITKHWILKEMALLQNLINQANEKGWRRELSAYMDKMLLLQTPAEQSRLLHDIPEIIADDAEVETADNELCRKDEKENNASPESASRGMSKPGRKSSSSNRISYNLNDGANFAEQKQQSEEPESKEMVQQHHTSPASGDDGSHQIESCESALEVKQKYSKASGRLVASIPRGPSNAPGSENQHHPSTSGESHEKPVDGDHEKVKNKRTGPQVELIELSDDEEQDTNVAKTNQTPDDLNSSIWYCVSPHGIKRGPYSMSVLKQWSDTSYSQLKFKVWKTDQSPEEAVFLTDAICQFFSGKN